MPTPGPWITPAPKGVDVDYAGTGASYTRTGLSVFVAPVFGTGDYATEAETDYSSGSGLGDVGNDNQTFARRARNSTSGGADILTWNIAQTKWDIGLVRVKNAMSFGFGDLPDPPATAIGVEYEQPDGSASDSPASASYPWLTDLRLRVTGDVNQREIAVSGGVEYEQFTAVADSTLEFRLESTNQALSIGARSAWLTGAQLLAKPLLLSTAYPSSLGATYHPAAGETPPVDSNPISYDIPIPLGSIVTTGSAFMTITGQFTDQQEHSPSATPGSYGGLDYLKNGSKLLFDTYAHALGTYQPPRYRWILSGRPPVRQLQRGDGLTGRGPRQWAVPSADVRQGPGAIR
jgi:hypothetical protein